MGKPKCTKQAIADAVRFKKNGMSNKDIAKCLSINERTFYRWLNEPKTDLQRQLGQSLHSAEAEYKAALRSRILKASEEDWRAAQALLQMQFPEEYNRKHYDQRVSGELRVGSIDPKARAEMDRLMGLDAE